MRSSGASEAASCLPSRSVSRRRVPDTERIKDTKTLDYASTPLDANTLLAAGHSVHRNGMVSPYLYFIFSKFSASTNLCRDTPNCLRTFLLHLSSVIVCVHRLANYLSNFNSAIAIPSSPETEYNK